MSRGREHHMTASRLLLFSLTALLIVAAMPAVIGQQARGNRTSASWTPPRAADGHPSLEGVWENNSATPLERPAQLKDKPRLTDEELSAKFADCASRTLPASAVTSAWASLSTLQRLTNIRTLTALLATHA